MDRANELAKLYKRVTKLDLPRVHSGLGDKAVAKAIDDLKAGTIDGVIAVDMLGEGFDLPNLEDRGATHTSQVARDHPPVHRALCSYDGRKPG